MIKINENYLKLQASYLFSEIRSRENEFQKANPAREIIKLGIGDVTRALPRACIEAFHRAVDEMADDATFRGYGPEQGYEFLREKIAKMDFQARGADIGADEIFVSDGAKCDTANIQEIFSTDLKVAIPDPVYPVYLDTNVMAGRTGLYSDGRYTGLVYLESTRENGFIPDLPERRFMAGVTWDAAASCHMKKKKRWICSDLSVWPNLPIPRPVICPTVSANSWISPLP